MTALRAESQEVHRSWLEAMGRGDFEAAWRQTDRLEVPRRSGGPVDPEIHLRWDGTPLRDRHVVVRCLHGLGDTVQFARYLPHIRPLAASLTTLVQPALLPLLQTTAEFGFVANGWTDDPTSASAVEIEIMELPYVFRSTTDTLPRKVPYFDTHRLLALSKLDAARFAADAWHVGVVWASSRWNSSRSIPLAALAPLATVRGVTFHSLQQDTEDDFDASPISFQPLADETRDILEAAAAMLRLDLILTVDTLTAHLAGALGRPVWLLLQHEADWRWQRTGETSPWYPTMRIFRQPAPGDWKAVGETVARELAALRTRSS